MSGAPPKAIRAALLVTPSGVVAPCWRLMLPIAPKRHAAVGARLSATVQRSGRLIFGQSRYQAVIAQSPIDSPTVRSCVEALLRADSYSAPLFTTRGEPLPALDRDHFSTHFGTKVASEITICLGGALSRATKQFDPHPQRNAADGRRLSPCPSWAGPGRLLPHAGSMSTRYWRRHL